MVVQSATFLFQWPGLSVPVQREKHERPEEDGKRNSPTRKVGIELSCCWVALTPMTHVSLFALQQNNPADCCRFLAGLHKELPTANRALLH